MEPRQHLIRVLRDKANATLLRISLGPSGPLLGLTAADLARRSAELVAPHRAARLQRPVLLLLPHSPELFLLHLGFVLHEACPAILPFPTTRIDPEKYQRNLLYQLRQLPAGGLVTIPELAANLAPHLPYPVSSCSVAQARSFHSLFDRKFSLDAFSDMPTTPAPRASPPHDAAFLQFSGGTTGAQKAVAVTGCMLEAQLSRLAAALHLQDRDAVVSWLPMYHDMGLIACFWLPLWFGLPSFQLAASDWLLCPESLFEFLDRYRGTLCWLPNFAFSYLAQRRPAMLGPFSLHHVRAWINCSEPVRLRSTRAFVDAFAEWGVRPAQIQASYAMAETVFAVTQSPLAGNPLTVPRAQVFANHSASLAYNLLDDVFVSSGPPLPDTQLRIIRDGAVCPDFQAGEIQLRTPSLFSGYWGPEGFRTDCFTADQWYATGDYGFLDQGHLYVIGRIKDIIIVGGQNVFPEDVEALANTVPGVYPGRAVAFGLDDESLGTQSLALVAEMRGDYSSQSAESIEAAIRRVVLTSLGIAPRRVLVVPERWILKSTAGKISRRETRDRFLLEADSLSLAAEPR